MISFRTLLESLGSPYQWRTKIDNNQEFEAGFVTGAAVRYAVSLIRTSSVLNAYSNWELVFFIDNEDEYGRPMARVSKPFDIASTGDAFRVFATVIDVLRYFIKRRSPARISFEAAEGSRRKLYARLVGMVHGELAGYRGKVDNSGRFYAIERDTPIGGYLK